MLNLDTHILIHALTDALTPQERDLLAGQEWGISQIVFWEIAKLAQLGRIEFDLDNAQLRGVLMRVHTWPVSIEVCRCLPSLDFHSDPADELIAATSIAHAVPLVTRDRRIRMSKVVPFADHRG